LGRFPYTRSGGGNNRHTWALILLPYIEQGSVLEVYQSNITGVTKTDGINNHTSTDLQIVSARNAQVPSFFCPSRRTGSSFSPITSGSTVTGVPSDYAACSGDTSTVPTSGVFQLVNSNHMTTPVRMHDILDGTNTTMLIGEKHIRFTSLNDYIQDGMIFSASEQQTYHRRAGPSNPLAINPAVAVATQFGSWHSGVCQFVFADGSVRALRNSVPGTTLGLFANRKDGQAISVPD
jgi:prepilin-type processing-associated H-X9-DG protein